MKYKLIKNGLHPNNTYIVYENTNCLIIDPSSGYEEIISAIEELNLSPVAILITHGHYDHIYSVDKIIECYNIDVYTSENTAKALSDSKLNYSKYSENALYEFTISSVPIIVYDGLINISEFSVEVVLNPGHSDGCTSFIIDDLCFTGDFIFKNRIGRTDLPSSSKQQMRVSLINFKRKPKKLIILPGHGKITTMEAQLLENKYLINTEEIEI